MNIPENYGITKNFDKTVTKIYLPRKEDCTLVTMDFNLLNNFVKYNKDVPDILFVDSDRDADIIVIFEQFSLKLWDYAHILKQCEMIRSCPSKVYTVNYDDTAQGFLPGCYTSLTRKNFESDFHQSCCYPKTHNEYTSYKCNTDINKTPQLLFSFTGSFRSHLIRQEIYKKLASCPDGRITFVDQAFHTHTIAQKMRYVEEIKDSFFVLCPRGVSPSTYRLFEVMSFSRCPVIISDDWVPISGIDWNKCSIRIKESDIPHIPKILAHRIHDAEKLGRSARLAWEKFFSEPERYRHYLSLIIGLHKHRMNRGVDISFQELCDRWASWSFFWRNGWTIPQRIESKVRRKYYKYKMDTFILGKL